MVKTIRSDPYTLWWNTAFYQGFRHGAMQNYHCYFIPVLSAWTEVMSGIGQAESTSCQRPHLSAISAGEPYTGGQHTQNGVKPGEPGVKVETWRSKYWNCIFAEPDFNSYTKSQCPRYMTVFQTWENIYAYSTNFVNAKLMWFQEILCSCCNQHFMVLHSDFLWPESSKPEAIS